MVGIHKSTKIKLSEKKFQERMTLLNFKIGYVLHGTFDHI